MGRLFRASRACVRLGCLPRSAGVDNEEIRVFNVRETYRIPWGIVHYWLSPGVIIPGSGAVRVSTHGGKRIVIDASMNLEPEVVDALERARSRAPLN